MPRSALLALWLAGATLTLGCDAQDVAGRVLAACGRPSFREVDAARAQRWRSDGDLLLLQARGEEPPARRVPGAALVAAADGAPAEAAPGRRIVVVAEETELGLRLGARLARAGVARVAVVSGGLPAWQPEPREE
jgi:hypothetical protein